LPRQIAELPEEEVWNPGYAGVEIPRDLHSQRSVPRKTALLLNLGYRMAVEGCGICHRRRRSKRTTA
jgi:hypothetical protein